MAQRISSARLVVVMMTLVAMVLIVARPTFAHSEYQREFLNLYTKGENADKKFKSLARKAKCYLCHQGKEDRKNNNRYGDALDEFLDEEDKKDKDKILSALQEVAEMLIDPEDENSPTYGELIAEGKLPGGPLEECKKEPESPEEG